MTCDHAQTWLLRGDNLPEVAAHVAGCPACQAVAADVQHLHDAWRALPLDAEAVPARRKFLARLSPAPGRRYWPVRRWFAAAILLLGIGLSLWFVFPAPEAQASSVLIERLVDWNIEMVDAGSAAERGRIFTSHQAELKEAVQQAPLPPADRDFAELLLENGAWLSEHDDPVAAAERFSAVADRLVERLQSASDRRDARLADRYARLQMLVANRGIADNLKKAENSGALNFENQRRLEKVILRDKSRMEALLELLERNPDISRRELRKALDIQPKNPKNTAPKR